MIKAILFDFDGVLTLDETGTQSICNYICKTTGVDKALFTREYREYNEALLTGKLSHGQIWDELCAKVGRPIDIGVLYDSFTNTPVNTDMLRLVQKLKAKNYKIGMITDNKADRIKSIVAYHHWETLFDGIAVSAQVGSEKSARKYFVKYFWHCA